MQEPAVQEPTVQGPSVQAAMPEATGAPPEAGPPPLRRDMARRMLGGVCAGIARTYDYDVTVVRIVALLLTLPGGFGLLLYAVLWVLMPADTGTPQPSKATPASSAEEIAERLRFAADEFAAATRAAAYATRVAAEQLADVARAASAAGRESWEQRPSAQVSSAAPTAPPDSSGAGPTTAVAAEPLPPEPLPPDPTVPAPPGELDHAPTNPPVNPPSV